MPLNDSQKIKINTVTGGKDKDDLKKCFFYPTTPAGPPYDLYKKENGVETLLASGITSGVPFSFPLDTYTWNVPDPNQPTNPFWINTQAAGGSWKNSDMSVSITDQSTGESGTFQAQAGTSPDPEEASSATA